MPLDVRIVHLLMNKPVGVVTSAADPEGRATIGDFLDVTERVWPVGRLDMDSEGALVVTNDGELTHRLTHPSFEVPKTYLAEVTGSVGARALKQLARGVELEDGMTKPARTALVERMPGSSLVELTIVEGRNRQVRRMMEEVGHPVKRLVRTAIGPLMLGRLKAGTFRKLSLDEVRALYEACGL